VNVFSSTQISLASENVKNFINEIQDKDNFLNAGKLCKQIQTLLKVKEFTNLEKIIFDLIVDHALKSEKQGPGSSSDFLKKYTSTFPICSSEQSSPNPIKENLRSIIEQFTNGSKFLETIVSEALQLSEFGGKIFVEKSISQIASIELISGNVFPVRAVFSNNQKFNDPKILCIDGHVETIGEIHHLLDQFNQNLQPLAIFARGFSNDVISTLKKNFDIDKLKIIPVIVPSEIDTINVLVDVALATDGDIISELCGNALNSISLKDMSDAKTISFYEKNTVIVPRKLNNFAIGEIRKKFNAASEFAENVTKNRAKSNVSNYVVIRLVDDINYISNVQTIDKILRSYSSLLRHGMMNNSLTSSTTVSDFYAIQCNEVINGLGAIVT
jgi:hypothetical protein